ncbi:MAG: type II secretion system protein [Planctomycetota bacterium]|jgi:prepilin-type N-terminal cleavage/methylation domain-containing protein|nr:type II secretion system protein [Planctomycetota bacterium]
MPYRATIPARRHAGFTLTELMIVIAVIVGMAGVGIPVWGSIRERARGEQTRLVLESVATAMTDYGRTHFTWRDANQKPRTALLWDVNADGILDGDPSLEGVSGYPADMLAAGYTGFVGLAKPELDQGRLNAKSQVLDGWGRPVHIAALDAGVARETLPWRLWSLGGDGQDTTGDEIEWARAGGAQ